MTWLRRLLRRDPERGSVTVEFAVLLPGLIILVSAIVGISALTSAQIRGTDAARQAARMSSVGEPANEVNAAVQAIIPGEVNLKVHSDGQWVSATVSHKVRLLGTFNLPLTVTSTAKTLQE